MSIRLFAAAALALPVTVCNAAAHRRSDGRRHAERATAVDVRDSSGLLSIRSTTTGFQAVNPVDDEGMLGMRGTTSSLTQQWRK